MTQSYAELYFLGREAAITDDVLALVQGWEEIARIRYRTGNPTTCPHGRPLVFRLSLAEIERAFDRR